MKKKRSSETFQNKQKQNEQHKEYMKKKRSSETFKTSKSKMSSTKNT